MTHRFAIGAATLALGLGIGLGAATQAQALPPSKHVWRNQLDIDPGVQFDRLYRRHKFMQRRDMQPRRMMTDGDHHDRHDDHH